MSPAGPDGSRTATRNLCHADRYPVRILRLDWLEQRACISIRTALCVNLSDGRIVGVPLAWFPQLLHGTAEQRGQVRTGSRGLHWEALDEDVSIAGLLADQGDLSPSHTTSAA